MNFVIYLLLILLSLLLGGFVYLFFKEYLRNENEILEIRNQLTSYNFIANSEFYKRELLNIFETKIKNRNASSIKNEGHWLEKCFGVKTNSNPNPDIFGFEIKKSSKKITFGDWSADEYIFKPSFVLNDFNCQNPPISKETFLKIFGTKNVFSNRFSWSGKCVPKYDTFNEFGQMLTTDFNDNIFIVYSHKYDMFIHKKPKWVVKQDIFILAYWSKDKIKTLVNNKFNKRGFVLCTKNNDNKYANIFFGKPINFELWIELLKKGKIFFDSGMYQGNDRYYSMWRASHEIWNECITLP